MDGDAAIDVVQVDLDAGALDHQTLAGAGAETPPDIGSDAAAQVAGHHAGAGGGRNGKPDGTVHGSERNGFSVADALETGHYAAVDGGKIGLAPPFERGDAAVDGGGFGVGRASARG